jgi:acyl-coenzyme A thioesterase PaaI-like protein
MTDKLVEESNSTKTYGFQDMLEGVGTIQPSISHQKRRDIAQSLREISSHIIRMSATDDELDAYVAELADLESRFMAQGKVDASELFKKMINQEATADDVLMGQDFGILNGRASALAFPMETKIIGDRVHGTAKVPLPFQGPPLRVHGGIVAAIFDVLLAQTQAIGKVLGYTASLEISYKDATPLNSDLELEAWIEKIDGRKMFNAGEIRANGKVCATAKGLWIQPKSNMFGMANSSK